MKCRGVRLRTGETGIGRMRVYKGTIDDPCRDMNAQYPECGVVRTATETTK